MKRRFFNKFLDYAQFFVLITVFLMLFGSVSEAVLSERIHLGFFNNFFVNFLRLPRKTIDAITYVKGENLHKTLTNKEIKSVNELNKDLYVFNGIYEGDKYTFQLRNIKNDQIIHQWYFDKKYFDDSTTNFQRCFTHDPILLKDMSMIGVLANSKNLFRLDKDSNIMWINHNDNFHHSIELEDQYIWACGVEKVRFYNEFEDSWSVFKDDHIVKVDKNTGETVFKKSITDLFIENNLERFIYGIAHNDQGISKVNYLLDDMNHDIFHLNDVQPALKDSKYYKKGDLFVSLRNISSIIQYRPSTNEIIRLIDGPFFFQHDVDIISDNKISIFNNNRTSIPPRKNIDINDDKLTINKNIRSFKSSQVITYNFEDEKFTQICKKQLEDEGVYTSLQGQQSILSDGSLWVEPTYMGIFYLFDKDGKLIYRDYANPIDKDGIREIPHWARVYENIDFIK